VKAETNPLSGETTTAAAGQGLFIQHCAICHGYYGSGKTEIGLGEYPHPPDLRSRSVQGMPDGELFYIIQNGIRYTGMPAWTLANDDIWRLVSYIRQLGTSAQ
jgi:mono/diheme cytochrome c family protein